MTRNYPYFSDNHKDIEIVAYNMWQKAGRPYGRSDEFWYAAIHYLKDLNDKVASGKLRPVHVDFWSGEVVG